MALNLGHAGDALEQPPPQPFSQLLIVKIAGGMKKLAVQECAAAESIYADEKGVSVSVKAVSLDEYVEHKIHFFIGQFVDVQHVR